LERGHFAGKKGERKEGGLPVIPNRLLRAVQKIHDEDGVEKYICKFPVHVGKEGKEKEKEKGEVIFFPGRDVVEEPVGERSDKRRLVLDLAKKRRRGEKEGEGSHRRPSDTLPPTLAFEKRALRRSHGEPYGFVLSFAKVWEGEKRKRRGREAALSLLSAFA